MKSRSRYPKNWVSIALSVKNLADWKCQKCGLQCLKPNDNRSKLSLRERAIKTLTVHHFDRMPENNSPENLIAVCSSCHLSYHQRGLGHASPGQLSLELKSNF